MGGTRGKACGVAVARAKRDDRHTFPREGPPVTSFLTQALLLLAVVMIIAAVFFRSRRAVEALRFLRKAAWGYVIAILLIAVWRLWQDGGF